LPRVSGKWVSAKTGASVLVFNATFNNISVIKGQSVLLVEETGVSR
jgi:SpoU rRNA methylase family enzyme